MHETRKQSGLTGFQNNRRSIPVTVSRVVYFSGVSRFLISQSLANFSKELNSFIHSIVDELTSVIEGS